jgi:predicted alpha/beta hydrolase family esterase
MSKTKSADPINSTNVRDKKFVDKMFYTTLKMLWLIWPLLTEKLVLRLFFSPRSYHLNQSEKQLLERGQLFQIDVNRNKIQCWKWGNGPVVILAHGWNGRGIQFQPLIEALITSNYSVICFDAPGHGQSQGKTSNYFEFTDALRALWHHVENQNVVAVIGHSLGAAAILNFISKENYNNKAFLIAPALKLRELLFKIFEQHNVPKMVYLNLVQNLEAKHGYSIFSDNPSQLIKTVKNNVVIFHDKNDRAVPFSHTNYLAERLDNITVISSSGLGHRRILNDKSVIHMLLESISGRKKIQKAS